MTERADESAPGRPGGVPDRDVGQAAHHAGPTVATQEPATTHEGVRVVLCDDQAVIRDVLRKVIGALPGMCVTGEAATGPDLLQALHTTPAEMVVIDVNLPGGGPTLAAILRQQHPFMSILVFSADGEPHLRQAMLEAGADDFIVKTGRLAPLRAALLAHAGGTKVRSL